MAATVARKSEVFVYGGISHTQFIHQDDLPWFTVHYLCGYNEQGVLDTLNHAVYSEPWYAIVGDSLQIKLIKCVVFEEELEDRASPSHFLVVPRKRLPRLSKASPDEEKTFDHLFQTARRVATERGLSGYHVTVDESHLTDRFLCLHVFGRALHHMLWPVGPGTRL